jgi:hypothetical protein
MLTSHKSRIVSNDTDEARMILAVALVSLATASCLLLLNALPPRPLQPDWLIQVSSLFLGLGPTLLLANLAIRLTPLLMPGTENSSRWRKRSKLLAMVLSLAFATSIPLQLISAERILQGQNQQDGKSITAARSAVAQITAASDLNSFRAALARVVQPQTIPQVFDENLPQLKTRTLARLEQSLRTSLEEVKRARTARRQSFWSEALRYTASAALLCLGFTALSRS